MVTVRKCTVIGKVKEFRKYYCMPDYQREILYFLARMFVFYDVHVLRKLQKIDLLSTICIYCIFTLNVKFPNIATCCTLILGIFWFVNLREKYLFAKKGFQMTWPFQGWENMSDSITYIKCILIVFLSSHTHAISKHLPNPQHAAAPCLHRVPYL